MLPSSLVVEISPEVSSCYFSRCALLWIFQCAVRQEAKVKGDMSSSWALKSSQVSASFGQRSRNSAMEKICVIFMGGIFFHILQCYFLISMHISHWHRKFKYSPRTGRNDWKTWSTDCKAHCCHLVLFQVPSSSPSQQQMERRATAELVGNSDISCFRWHCTLQIADLHLMTLLELSSCVFHLGH